MIVNLDVLHFGELLEVIRQQIRDGVRVAAAITNSGEINIRHTIGQLKFTVAREAIV